ncbi:hypothetical protein GCM10010358_80420 [Streptomyces minutiscleroticus]|uniref:Transposase n=1 Tax=Streptomyces minutiscleroticus TaxID=68238 RepID=A0A918UA19_9ACTN|nr:hypothetical protein GCM10010358_80420 [Streptomyces minutiscleroticus]
MRPGASTARATQEKRTRLYLQRRSAQGKTKREAIRCLKRYVAREVYRFIVAAPLPQPQPMAA